MAFFRWAGLCPLVQIFLNTHCDQENQKRLELNNDFVSVYVTLRKYLIKRIKIWLKKELHYLFIYFPYEYLFLNRLWICDKELFM